MSLAVSGEIVLELDIEDPVHAFDAPVSADGGGDAVDVEGGGGDIGSGFAGCFAGLFGVATLIQVPSTTAIQASPAMSLPPMSIGSPRTAGGSLCAHAPFRRWWWRRSRRA